MQRRHLIQAAGALPVLALARTAFAFDGPELYAGEKALYAEAQKEGLCVSFDTGPEWANWKSLFRDFKKRYPEIELTYNDIGSAATVVALERAKRPPAGRHRLLLRRLGRRRRQEGRGRAVQARELRQAAGRVPRGRGQLVHHPHAQHRLRWSTGSW